MLRIIRHVSGEVMNLGKTQPLLGGGFLIMLAVLLFGFIQNPMSLHALFSPGGAGDWATFTLVFWFVTVGLYFTNLKRFIHIIVPLCIIIITIPTMGFGAWGAIVFLSLSAFASGEAVCRKIFIIEVSTKVEMTVAMLIGVAIYVTFMNLLVHFPVNYLFTYLCLMSIPIVLNRHALFELFVGVRDYCNHKEWKNIWEYSAFNLLCYFLLIHFLHSTQAEQMFDALAMHLVVPHQVSVNHLWGFDFINHIWAVMPMNGDWLYTIVYVLAGEFAARLSNMVMLLLLLVMIVGVSKEFLGRGLSYLMGALFLSSPLVHLESSSLFIENVWAAFSLAAVIALLNYRIERRSGYLYAAMLLLGAALATKMIAIFLIVIMALVVVLDLVKYPNKQNILKVIAISMAIIICVGTIPYINAYILTENPMFPFYNAIFQSPYLDGNWSFDQPHFKQGISLWTLYDMTFHSSHYAEANVGVPGYQYLLFLPLTLLAVIKNPRSDIITVLVLGVVFVVAVFQFQSYLRYIYPVFPLFSIAIAYLFAVVRELNRLLFLVLIVSAIVIIFLNVRSMPGVAFAYNNFPIKNALLGKQHVVPARKVIDYLNVTCGTHCRVGVLSGGVIAGLDGKSFSHNWHTWDFTIKVRNAADLAAVEKIAKGYRLNYLIVREGDTNLNDAVRDFIVQHCERVFSVQGMSVYKIRRDFMLEEVLLNNDFHDGLAGWAVSGNVVYDKKNDSVKISDNDFLTQVIPAEEGALFNTSITARCNKDGGYVRLQANWLNKKGAFVSATVIPKRCDGKYKQLSEMMVAPPNATKAIVYLIAHGAYEVDVKNISFLSY